MRGVAITVKGCGQNRAIKRGHDHYDAITRGCGQNKIAHYCFQTV